MKLLGMTGGVGMGKSTCARLLQQRGFPLVDTDDLARELVQPGQPALAAIVDAFGAGMLDESGQLRRRALADVVFADDAARKRLEGILHPRIQAAWQMEAARWRDAGATTGVVVIPLLYETGAAAHFDAILCLACTPGTQRARLAGRGWPEAEAQRRIAAQWPVSEKMARATHVIWTEGSLEALADQVRRIPGLG